MKYYIDIENRTYGFGNDVTDEAIAKIEVSNNISLTRITLKEYKAIIAPTLDELKTAKINEINTACKNEIISGFVSNALGTEHHYQSEETDQLNLIGVVTAGVDDFFKAGVADLKGAITWSYKMHTIVQLKQVLQDGKARKQTLLQKAGTLKARAETATLKELKLIVW